MSTTPEFLVEPLPQRAPPPERWLRIAPPSVGESLTSWLSRQARLWGVPLSSLLRDVLPPDEKYVPDLDVNPPTDLVKRLAARFGVSISEVERATFRQALKHLMRPEDLTNISLQRSKQGHLPWILPSGWQGTHSVNDWKDRGIPYCPVCVSEQRGLPSPLAHRLAFHVACERHKVLLLDRCPTCETRTSPAILELQTDVCEGTVGIRCELCSSMLPSRAPLIEKADARILGLQSLLSSGLNTGVVQVPQLGQFPTIRYLRGLRYVLSAVTRLREQGISLPPARQGKAHPYAAPPSGGKGGTFETQPLSRRVERLRDAAWILEAPLDRWPLLFQLCGWPANFPRWWHHPWEGLTDTGTEIRKARGGVNASQPSESRDVQKVRAFFDLVEDLGIHPVRVQGMLGNISSYRYHRWRSQPGTRFPLDCYRRMELFLALWGRLLEFFNTREQALEWLMKPNGNSIFRGKAPIDSLVEEGCTWKLKAANAMFGDSDSCVYLKG